MNEECMMVVFSIENAAFISDLGTWDGHAIAEQLRTAAEKIERSGDLNGVLTDVNGNCIGFYQRRLIRDWRGL